MEATSSLPLEVVLARRPEDDGESWTSSPPRDMEPPTTLLAPDGPGSADAATQEGHSTVPAPPATTSLLQPLAKKWTFKLFGRG